MIVHFCTNKDNDDDDDMDRTDAESIAHPPNMISVVHWTSSIEYNMKLQCCFRVGMFGRRMSTDTRI